MNAKLLEDIVNAVLYEGYILYPYRPSSKKNRRERFTFGRVYPEVYSVAHNGVEPALMQTECLARLAGATTKLQVSIGFLHPLAREIGEFQTPLATFNPEALPPCAFVPEMRVGDDLFQAWHEAVERKISAPVLLVAEHSPVRVKFRFSFPASCEREPIRGPRQEVVGFSQRTQQALAGMVEISLQPLRARLCRVTVQIRNQSAVPQAEWNVPDAVLMRTFASTHMVLTIQDGEFISSFDPEPDCRAEAAACRNLGAWPVLVGDESRHERDTLLSSPIILYDYPKIAPESAGPLFDGTEIDEILTLRILTMTDAEKREMRRVDEQARRLLERTEALSEKSLLGMHGTVRNFEDFFGANKMLAAASIDGVPVRAGDRVRLRPKARADVIDLALAGRTAIVEAVEEDVEQRVHLAVVLEDDPGRDLGMLRQPGHRFFYGLDEVEPLQEVAS